MDIPKCAEFRRLQPLLSRRSLLELGMLGTIPPLRHPRQCLGEWPCGNS
jgi:hypothetical protein